MKKIFLSLFSLLACSFILYAQPVINSFSPTLGPVGTPVIIAGQNFDPNPANDVVYFGAVKAIVNSASSTSLNVTVPVGATYQPISVIIGGLTAYSTKAFDATFPAAINTITPNSFAAGAPFTTGANPVGISIADFNGDGKSDLVTLNAGANTVSVLRNSSNNGTIAFANKVDLPVGSGPSHITVGDLDGDGKLDIVVTNYDGNTVSVLRNTSSSSTITFASKVDFQTGAGAYGVSVSDLDGDGKLDIAVTNFSSKTLSVLRNTSSVGTIAFESKVDYPTGSNPSELAIKDLDGDGKPDIAVSASTNVLFVMRNMSSNGSFAFIRSNFVVGQNPGALVLGDLDNDGKPDVAAVSINSNVVSVLRNTSSIGTITFESKVDYPTDPTPVNLAIGDIDGDGKPDLVVLSINSPSGCSVLRNTSTNGTIAFASRVGFGSAPGPYDLAVADLNGDSKPDVAATSGQNYAIIFLNQIPTECSPPTFLNNNSIVLDASCGKSDGNISIIPQSGIAPFLYSIDGGTTYVNGSANGFGFQNLAAGTYQLRLRDANGCESAIVTKEIKEIYGCNQCTPPTFLNDQTIVLDAFCNGNDGNISIIPTSGTAPFIYSIDGGATYVAGPNSGYTFQSLSAGTYQLRLKDAGGCESAIITKEVKPNAFGPCATLSAINPKLRSSIENNAALVRIYPNPSHGQFKLQFQRFASASVQVQILNSKGSVLQTRSLTASDGNILDINLQGKAKGLYFVRVISDKYTQVQKITVQ